jgi:hypothetical protein
MCFSSLPALEGIQRTVLDNAGSRLEVVEALPGREEYWGRDDQGRRRASEILALLRW